MTAAQAISFKPTMQPLWEYQVIVDGLRQAKVGNMNAPLQRFTSMDHLTCEGVVGMVPLGSAHASIQKGTRIRWWEQQTDWQQRGNVPAIEGYISVEADAIIQTECEMVGEHIFCSPISLPTKHGLSLPKIRFDTVDTTKKATAVHTHHYTDRGLVSLPNDHYPIGTVLYWFDSELARHDFLPSFGLSKERGFLIKNEYVSIAEEIN